jgi:gluconolactonase
MRRFLAAALTGALALLLIIRASGAADSNSSTVARGLQFPEGTIFVGNTLYFVDYATSDVFRLGGAGPERVWHGDTCGPTGLLRMPYGLLVACYAGGTIDKISLEGRTLEAITSDSDGNAFVAPNDLAADGKGGVYFSTSGSNQDPGKVYYLAPGFPPLAVASGISDCNGLVTSLDGHTLYVAESNAKRLLAFAIKPDGSLTGRHVFVTLSDILSPPQREYTPDGVRMDKHGRLFVGLYDGGGFAVIDASGHLVKRASIAGTHHANLAISPDGKSVFGTTMYDLPRGYRGEIYRAANPVAE